MAGESNGLKEKTAWSTLPNARAGIFFSMRFNAVLMRDGNIFYKSKPL